MSSVLMEISNHAKMSTSGQGNGARAYSLCRRAGMLSGADYRNGYPPPTEEADKEMLNFCRIAEFRTHVLLKKSGRGNASVELVGKKLASPFPSVSCNS